MIPYFKLAAENGYTVLVLEPHTEWSHDPSRLAAMTSHGVPRDKIELMQSRWKGARICKISSCLSKFFQQI